MTMSNEEFLDDHEMDLFGDFLNMSEDQRTFILHAGPEGFSPADIEKVFTELRMFVSARIMKKWDEIGESPKTVGIQISLDIA